MGLTIKKSQEYMHAQIDTDVFKQSFRTWKRVCSAIHHALWRFG
ncbi:MAG: hypothetical protein QXU87_07940 [Candidatus Caldarchaeum sp.]